jgi:hypothetical protein
MNLKLVGILFAVMALGGLAVYWNQNHPGDKSDGPLDSMQASHDGHPVYPSDHYVIPSDHMFTFANTRGPGGRSVVPTWQKTSWQQYAAGSNTRLAILLTDENSPWLGVAHGLKSFGVPFLITTNYKKALQHNVVLVYPTISGVALPPEGLRALAAFPRNGGVLMGVNVVGGGLNETFGFTQATAANTHREIQFDSATPFTQAFTHPHERVIRLEKSLIVNSYSQPKNKPLATYEDGSAAITQKAFEKGRAYAFGMDLGQYILKGHNGRQEGISRTFVNAYEPHADMLLRLVRNIYLSGQPNAVTIGTVPQGKELSVIFTHDIDFTRSIRNAVEYARYEKENGVPATHFIQTKYIRDFNDDIFFNDAGAANAREIHALGQNLASHSVAHSKTFYLFPMGSGQEQYPDYQSFVKERFLTYNGTILGELRISKFLVEHAVPGATVESFRPGHLSNPFQLPEGMEAAGYRYSSSTTADNDLTHLPYQLNYGRGTEAESPIFEFPITVEDELPPRMDERLGDAVALAKQLKKEGGSFVILVHPNVLDYKLAFEKGFAQAVKPFAWFGNMETFGAWWVASNAVTADVQPVSAKQLQLQLNAPVAIEALSIRIPTGWQLDGVSKAGISQRGRQLLIQHLQGRRTLVLNR